MLLAAVIACLGSFSVATAADYAVNSADEFVTAWNQAAASNEASTITITVPSGSDNITLTQEQRAQLNAISGRYGNRDRKSTRLNSSHEQ